MRKDIILKWARAAGLEISDAQLNMLAAFQERVLTVNRYMNLTAITNDEDFAVKHIIDSLTLLPHIKQNARIADIGTGAGFPGLVLRIMREDLRLTLVDSLRKRVIFLRETTDMLGLGNVECLHARAERLAPQATPHTHHVGLRILTKPDEASHANKDYREFFDVCTARAVAGLDKLAGYTLPLVKKGGVLLAMKGRGVTQELENAKPALKKHGGAVKKVVLTEISEGLTHSIVIVKKI